jgi:hypothetical protein
MQRSVYPCKHPQKGDTNHKIGGNGLVVETTNPQGLKAFTENGKLEEAGLNTSTPQRKHPRMIMYDVPRDISEKKILACMKR